MKNNLYNKHKKYIEWFKNEVPLFDYSLFDNLELLDKNFEKKANFKEIQKYEYIVIHHAEINCGNAQYYRWLHKAIFNWDDVGYHYIIGNGKNSLSIDGEIELGRNISFQGAHVKDNNHNTIGICLSGNLDKYPPSEKQLISLKKIIKQLRSKFNIDTKIKFHRDFEDVIKSCPGKYFPYKDFS